MEDDLLQLQADFREPDAVERVDLSGATVKDQLLQRIDRYGFALTTGGSDSAADNQLSHLSTMLGLREPYIPVLYRLAETKEYSSAYSDIRGNSKDFHPGFSTTAGQALHVDGLLDEIGKIKVTILYCIRPADRGGDTVLFNSLAAFMELREIDPAAAHALMSPTALTRRSTIPGIHMSATGPAFSIDSSGELVARYTDNETCTWDVGNSPSTALQTALDFLRNAAENPRYGASVRLGGGEALVFRNDRLSHGRTSYEDTPDRPRHLVRALFDDAPPDPR